MVPRKEGYEFCDRHAAGKPPLTLAPAPPVLITEGDTWVYFIQEEFTKCVKIGKTVGKPLTRLSALQTGSPSDLKLLFAVLGPDWLEVKLHSLCAEWKRRGEWFEFSTGLQSLMDRLEKHAGFGLPPELCESIDAAKEYSDIL